jgi:HD-like signal output (HDOD) protein
VDVTQKYKVLFVDDDPHILQGLQRMLHYMRKDWDMNFVEGGEAGLSLLGRESVDVLVTDMKMPGMDGIKLLTEVKKHFPDVVRLVLSGYSDYQMILMSVPLAHQFLTKPCDPKTLVATVNRTCSLRDLLGDANLKKLVTEISSLPSLPTLYTELEQAINTEETSICRIAEIIGQDMAMAAKVMQIANSAFLGLPRKINNPEEAVLFIGLRSLQSLILSTHIFSQFKNGARFRTFLDNLWMHTQATAVMAKSIGQKENMDKTMHEHASTAGLLHDCGKLVLADNFPDAYEQALTIAGQEGIPLWQAEEKILGAHHGSVGAYLLGIWGLPSSIIEALAFHHHPKSFSLAKFDVLTSVHIADALEQQNGALEDTHGMIDMAYLSELGLGHHLPLWQNLAKGVKEKRKIHAAH